MSLIVIEKSSGKEVAWSRNNGKAFIKASKRSVARDDMAFVVDDPDIRAYRVAQIFVNKYDWLPQFLYEKGKGKDVIDLAMDRLNLWSQIMTSRVVVNPEYQSVSLSALFGQQLANEINLVCDFYDNPERAVLAPLTLKVNEEAIQSGYDLASRYKHRQFLLAVHDLLGVYVIGPSELIARHVGFSIKRIFVREMK